MANTDLTDLITPEEFTKNLVMNSNQRPMIKGILADVKWESSKQRDAQEVLKKPTPFVREARRSLKPAIRYENDPDFVVLTQALLALTSNEITVADIEAATSLLPKMVLQRKVSAAVGQKIDNQIGSVLQSSALFKATLAAEHMNGAMIALDAKGPDRSVSTAVEVRDKQVIANRKIGKTQRQINRGISDTLAEMQKFWEGRHWSK